LIFLDFSVTQILQGFQNLVGLKNNHTYFLKHTYKVLKTLQDDKIGKSFQNSNNFHLALTGGKILFCFFF